MRIKKGVMCVEIMINEAHLSFPFSIFERIPLACLDILVASLFKF